MDIRIEVFKREIIDNGWPAREALAFLEWFTCQVESIPAEFRDSAVIDIDSVSSYESTHYASIEIYYTRPETEQEEASRVAENACIERRREDLELKQLAELKRKYEDKQ